MVFRAMSGLIMSLFFSLNVWADELKINPNHPDQYTVVSGDTLWDIAGKFLQHPWKWPQLWENNRQIKDPHWIYPGDTLYFSYQNGVPRLSFSAPGGSSGAEEKLLPQARESDIDKAIRMIPSDAISQFLNSPKVVNKDELMNSPYVVDIAGDERLIAGAGDRIYVRGIDQPQGLGYTVYRQGEPYISPDTHEILGYEAQYVGDATLERTGDPATLLIKKSNGQIRQGDRLMTSFDNGLALNYFPKPPQNEVLGHIIRVMGGITQIGLHDIVVIDKGSVDGLEAGHTLNIYRTGRVVADRYRSEHVEMVKLPDEIAGVIMIFRPFERVSYALVMEAAGAIHTMDSVKTH